MLNLEICVMFEMVSELLINTLYSVYCCFTGLIISHGVFFFNISQTLTIVTTDVSVKIVTPPPADFSFFRWQIVFLIYE